MAKKRTKKEKASAKHQFLISWDNTTNQAQSRTVVKGQTTGVKPASDSKSIINKNTDLLVKDADLTTIKKNIVRSLAIASLILATEVVLYFFWNVRY